VVSAPGALDSSNVKQWFPGVTLRGARSLHHQSKHNVAIAVYCISRVRNHLRGCQRRAVRHTYPRRSLSAHRFGIQQVPTVDVPRMNSKSFSRNRNSEIKGATSSMALLV